jgi:hypothetical protein
MRIWGSERSLAERHDLVSETSGCVGESPIGGPATGPRYPCAVITLFGGGMCSEPSVPSVRTVRHDGPLRPPWR